MPLSLSGTTGIVTGNIGTLQVTTGRLANLAVTTGKLADANVTYGKLSNSATEADNVAQRTAKAWVNWNGTNAFSPNPSTSAIRSDFNVSSITDYGTGKYGVNFTAAMSDANYAVLFSGGFDPGLEPRIIHTIDSDHAQTTSAVRVNSMSESGSQRDSDRYGVVVFD